MNSDMQARMNLLMRGIEPASEEVDSRTAQEIVTDGLTAAAESYGWDLDAIENRPADEEGDVGEYVEFTFRRGRSQIVTGFEMATGKFVTCIVETQILDTPTMMDVFKQLGNK